MKPWVALWLEPGFSEFAYVIVSATTQEEAVNLVTPWIEYKATHSEMLKESLMSYPHVYPTRAAVIADFSRVMPLDDALTWADSHRVSVCKGDLSLPVDRKAQAYYLDHDPAFSLGTGLKAWESWRWRQLQTTGV